MAARKTPPRRSSRSSPTSSTSPDPVKRARAIYGKLRKLYPDAGCSLAHSDPFQLLVATILSAQCTDARVNMVTPNLFAKYPTPQAMADARQADLERLIRSTGFYRNKAKSIRGACRAIVEQYGGAVPDSMDALVQLPGVARKTANVVLGNAMGKAEGIAVDTHAARLSKRLAFSGQSDPVKIERDLMELFTRRTWTLLTHLLIHHGRAVCDARRPLCEQCTLATLCPKVGVDARR